MIFKLILAVFIIISTASIISAEEPTPTVTEPTPTVTVTEPTPTVTVTEPTPTVTVTEPTPTVTATTPEPTPANTTPVPTNTTPVPTNTTPVPTNTTPIPTNTTPAPTKTTSGGGNGGSSGGSSGNSGGGSGGGMRASSFEPFSNILKYESREEKLVANQSVEYSFSSPELSIYKVSVNGRQNEYDVSVRVESLKNRSVLVNKTAPGIIYRYENVLIGTKRLNYISVGARVKNSWMEENGLNETRHPYILKYNGTTWIVLATNITGKDGIYTYIESPRAGGTQLGVYAISGPPKKENNGQAWSTPTIVKDEVEIVPVKEEIEVVEANTLPGFEIIITIIGMIISMIYVVRKNKI